MREEKRGFQISLFAGLVAIVLLAAAFGPWSGEENPLLGKDSAQTLYASAAVGETPDLHAEDYFPEGQVDPSRLSYDLSACDTGIPGTYRIPVLYDGQETNCVFELTVEEEREPGLDLPESGYSGQEIRISD